MGQDLDGAYAVARAATSGYGSSDGSSLVTHETLLEDALPEWKQVLLYTTGAGYEFTNDMLLGIPGILGLNDWADSLGSEFNAGRIAGANAALTVGSIEVGAGLAVEVGGGAACLTGAGCVVGAPAAGVGALTAVVGAGQVGVATTYLAKANNPSSSNYKPVPEGDFVDSLKRAKSKSHRKRWVDSEGNIYEWDSQHGEVEKYDKRGHHQGAYDPRTGERIKAPVPGRRIEP